MVATNGRAVRTRDERIALVTVIASATAILTSVVFGMLGIALNQAWYMIANGSVPSKPEEGFTSRQEQWAGHMMFTLPWWYFALTGAVVLAVAIVAVNPRWRFHPANPKYFAYRTTAGYLVIVGVLLALLHNFAAGFYDLSGETFSLYSIGPALCLLSAVVALAAKLFGPKTPKKPRYIAPITPLTTADSDTP